MKLLNTVTKDLLNENEKLRRHFSKRTQDVSQLMFTIQKNIEENVSDHAHQAHLLKESNCLLVKQIERLRKGE